MFFMHVPENFNSSPQKWLFQYVYGGVEVHVALCVCICDGCKRWFLARVMLVFYGVAWLQGYHGVHFGTCSYLYCLVYLVIVIDF